MNGNLKLENYFTKMLYNQKNNLNFIHLHKCCGKAITSVLYDKNFKRTMVYKRQKLTGVMPNGKPFNCHDGVNEVQDVKNRINFISIRDIVELYCSKISYINRGRCLTPSGKPLSDKELINSINYWLPKFLYDKKVGSDKRIKLHEKFPEIGIATKQMLFQTCLIKDEIEEDNIEDFFKNNNIVDFIVRKDSLQEDLQHVLKSKIKMEHKNKSPYTKKIMNLLTGDMLSKINERESFFQKAYLGELDDCIRGNFT